MSLACLTASVQAGVGENKVRGLMGQKTAQSIVPSNESSDDTKSTTSSSSTERVVEFTSSQKNKGNEQEKEEGNKTDVAAVRSDEQDTSEDTPSKKVKSKRLKENRLGNSSIGFKNTKAWDEDGSKGHPETTIAGEGSSTKCVTCSELPHTSEQLSIDHNVVRMMFN